MRRNTQQTVRNKHSVIVIRATIGFYIAIRLDEILSLLWAFGNLTIRVRWIHSTTLSIRVRWTDPTNLTIGQILQPTLALQTH